MTQDVVSQLRERLGKIADIRSAINLLQWDQETYMPPKAADERAQQLATLASLAHSLFISSEMETLLNELDRHINKFSEQDRQFIDVVRYDYDRSKRLPESLVHEIALETSRALPIWVEARKTSNFLTFLPSLEKLVELSRKKADLLGYEESPYDALLEDYERGMTARKLREVFGQLLSEQTSLVRRIVESSRQSPSFDWAGGVWEEDKKFAFYKRVLQDLGYDFEAGRQDLSVHPFSISAGLYDVRITTRTTPEDLFHGLMAIIHECGHALYSQGHDPTDQRTPLLDAPSLGMHESQSRLWENLIGRSLPFWEFYTPILQSYFPQKLSGTSPQEIYRFINQVKPSPIRVDADECTYNLHIVVRFEIELGMIEGTLLPRDVPDIWNDKMKQYLGVEIRNDAEGCLQDIHWAHGAFGYFPTYALGNLYAAQLFEAIQQDLPNLWEEIRNGVFSNLLGWLREKVHRWNRRKLASEIIHLATGSPLQAKPFLKYLETKYRGLYGIPLANS